MNLFVDETAMEIHGDRMNLIVERCGVTGNWGTRARTRAPMCTWHVHVHAYAHGVHMRTEAPQAQGLAPCM